MTKNNMWNKLKNPVFDYLKYEELEKWKILLHNEVEPSLKSITIPRKQAFDIYNVRARLPAAVSGKIRGFDRLLEELDKTKDDKISIHLISSSNIKLLVFTDYDITRVLGVLTFSEQRYDEK